MTARIIRRGTPPKFDPRSPVFVAIHGALLGPAATARAIGVSRGTIYRWLQAGRVPTYAAASLLAREANFAILRHKGELLCPFTPEELLHGSAPDPTGNVVTKIEVPA